MEQDEFRDLAVNNQAELEHIKAGAMASSLYNEDLAPTGPERRTWTTYNIAALWIGMSVVITTYLLASTLMAAGMNWWQALFTIALGNLIVLIPMLLNAHAGTKYGVPFPVFVRASFGVRGANFAAIARALVACGWFGIQTWLGGAALDALTRAVWGGWANVHSLLCLLGHTGRDHHVRCRGGESLRVSGRAASPARRDRAPYLGFLRGGRYRQRLHDFGQTAAKQYPVLDALLAIFGGERGVLDHALPQHP